MDAFANKPEIPYSPQDLNEPPLEHKPKAQPAAPHDAKPQEPANGQQAQPSQPSSQPQEPAPTKPEATSMPHVHCASSAPIPHVKCLLHVRVAGILYVKNYTPPLRKPLPLLMPLCHNQL